MATTTERHSVFLTGATGSIGLAATQAMIAAGHEVVGVTRSHEGAESLRELGATPVEVDLFDRAALHRATRDADVIAHFATKIPEGFAALMPGGWRTNDRLRREATRNLLQVAAENGVRRFIFESYYGAYPDQGEVWIDESIELRPAVAFMKTVAEAEAMLGQFGEQGGEAVSLRFGRLYGPGRASMQFTAAMMKRQMPIVGHGDNFVPSVHVADAATAIVAALEVKPGTYNVVDDEPLRQRDLLIDVAEILGAPVPRRLPYPVARMLLGGLARALSSSQRVSNRRFREAAEWTPRFPSAIEGWRDIARSELAPPIEAELVIT